MQDRRASRSILGIVSALGWPLIFGLIAYSGLFILIRKEVITNALLVRYLESHPVSYVATAMFCVGVAALILRASDLVRQWQSLKRIELSPRGDSPASISDAGKLLDELDRTPARYHHSLLWQRLRTALQLVQTRSSASELDEELKYLADQDADKQTENYSLVRILIWATPMLGFLGTVIGISEALGGLEVGGDFEKMMAGLRNSLYVAFDTTALALTLSILLMFGQYIVERFESTLLGLIEQIAANELTGRFEEVGGSRDPIVRSLERLATSMMGVTGQLVEQQSELWQQSMSKAQRAWEESAQDQHVQLQDQLQLALEQSLASFAAKLHDLTLKAEDQAGRRWEQLQVSISDNARKMAEQQCEMIRQTELVQKTLESTGDVIRLESALNQNLNSLNEAGRFDDTLNSLAAAINLLNSRAKTITHSGPDGNARDNSERAA